MATDPVLSVDANHVRAIVPAHATSLGATVVAGSALVSVLGVCVPLFLCLPLWVDAYYLDLCARSVLRGGVHYRDTFDIGLPGFVWVHMAVRQLFGWHAAALRCCDLAVLAGIVVVIGQLQRRVSHTLPTRLGTAAVVFFLYFALPEICHVQRDVWMVLPALLGLMLRLRQVDSLCDTRPSRVSRVAGLAALEGLVWGAAVWIKPFVIIPGALTYLAGSLLVRRAGVCSRSLTLADCGGLLAGGIAAGFAGICWLWTTGSWPFFVEIMFEWNREYIRDPFYSPIRLLDLARWTIRYAPWSLPLVAAIPVACGALRLRPQTSRGARTRFVLAVFFLGWLTQAVCFQFRHDYVLASVLLPAIAVLAVAPRPRRGIVRAALIGGLACMVVTHPLLRPDRLQLWRTCLVEGGSPPVRDRLSLTSGAGHADWQDLRDVEAFLRAAGVRDGELTCWDDSSVSLLIALDVTPSTRFPQHGHLRRSYPGRVSRMLQETLASSQRYVVNDLLLEGLTEEQVRALEGESLEQVNARVTDEMRTRFPWSEPVVFKSGRYLVHRVGD